MRPASSFGYLSAAAWSFGMATESFAASVAKVPVLPSAAASGRFAASGSLGGTTRAFKATSASASATSAALFERFFSATKQREDENQDNRAGDRADLLAAWCQIVSGDVQAVDQFVFLEVMPLLCFHASLLSELPLTGQHRSVSDWPPACLNSGFASRDRGISSLVEA